jgi:hypothetical protein
LQCVNLALRRNKSKRGLPEALLDVAPPRKTRLRLRSQSDKLGKLSKPVLEARAASRMMRSPLAAIV